MNKESSKVLVIYTGGTIGMVQDPHTGLFKPFNFVHLIDQVPELKNLNVELGTYEFETPIDSSDVTPDFWVEIAEVIETNYESYDGFVVLHGSDTMAYTASALSFMFNNLSKPVILTGSQIPIGVVRTDGKENLITAIEIAAAKENGEPIVPEVAIYFEYALLRGNRSHKKSAEYFDAFESTNYPKLAEAGIRIDYNRNRINKPSHGIFSVNKNLDNNIAILKLFPGINQNVVNSILNIKGLKGVVLETYGSGNATTQDWFIKEIETACKKGIIVLNITQCASGKVEQGRYSTSAKFNEIGVIGGNDMTTEAAITKLMFLLGQNLKKEAIIKYLKSPIRGELTV